jgi:hypothetical protein
LHGQAPFPKGRGAFKRSNVQKSTQFLFLAQLYTMRLGTFYSRIPGLTKFEWKICYVSGMKKPPDPMPFEVAAARQRRLEAMHLQDIEGNPLTQEEVRMFEMFEREAWSDEQCRAYILAKVKSLAAE